MDKNTLNGLLLMAAVFLLFMWLSPKGKEEAKDAETTAKTEQTASVTAEPFSDT